MRRGSRRRRPGRHRLRAVVAIGLACAVPAAIALAQLPTRVEPPGPTERAKSQRQRDDVAALARRRLGTPLRDGDLRDLEVLQRLLDRGAVDPDDVAGLQALGVALGDVMVENLPLEWVVVDDELGRSRALRLERTDRLYFPVTMISKRVTHREPVDVRGLYDRVAADVARLRARDRPKPRSRVRPERPVPGGEAAAE